MIDFRRVGGLERKKQEREERRGERRKQERELLASYLNDDLSSVGVGHVLCCERVPGCDLNVAPSRLG